MTTASPAATSGNRIDTGIRPFRMIVHLVLLALDSGGRDNVTVIVAGYTFPD